MKNQSCVYAKILNFVLLIFALISSIYFISCASAPDFVDKPVGNKIDLQMINNIDTNELELLFVCEDTIYTLTEDSKVLPIPVKDINQITVQGYSDRFWILGVLGLQVVPPILMGIAASHSSSAWALTVIMLIPAAIEIALFESSTPENPKFNSPLKNKIAKLKKYARYPIEMKREQIDAIEKFYGISSNIKNNNKK